MRPGRNATPFTQLFDARFGISTGTSAFDRARTVAVAVDPNSTPHDLVRGKGHMNGLRAKDGGVLVRSGHTEGSVDLAKLAGLKPAAVICEVVHPDGTMARLPYLREFCREHGIKMCTIEDLIKFRRQRERLIQRELVVKLPTRGVQFPGLDGLHVALLHPVQDTGLSRWVHSPRLRAWLFTCPARIFRWRNRRAAQLCLWRAGRRGDPDRVAALEALGEREELMAAQLQANGVKQDTRLLAVETPLNTLEADTLCPGSAVLDKINASLR